MSADIPIYSQRVFPVYYTHGIPRCVVSMRFAVTHGVLPRQVTYQNTSTVVPIELEDVAGGCSRVL